MKAALLLAAVVSAPLLAAPPLKTSCMQCHGSEMFDAAARAKVDHFHLDVHAQVGLSCHDCHGGNPDPKLAEDMPAAMDPKYAPNPYVGSPKRGAVPDFCGRCHSSAVFMNRFNPGMRVDQVSEYWTSRHGQLLRKGDANVATCIDCHSVHDIRRKTSPDSPVYATHVAETCSRCHSDAKRMASYGIPVDQHERWKRSVHAAALLEKGDLVAPTCNDCHGNHGATPPGVASIQFVCGRCHAREAELFHTSPKASGFARHNELLAAAPDGCGTCHEDARGGLRIKQFSDCVTCHENHAVMRPTVAMLGTLPDTPCAFCHEGVGPLAGSTAEPEKVAAHYAQLRAALLRQADQLQLKGNDRFDWLVDQAVRLPTHLVQPAVGGAAKPRLRPEFARLFDKFRIGATHYAYRDPANGRLVRVGVRTCVDCHVTPESLGRVTAATFLAETRSLTSMIARAERILLAAQRGGVEVRSVRPELDNAIDNQIEVEALVHSFNPGGLFAEKQREGLQHARAAMEGGQRALHELTYRRRGLLIALAVIIGALVALALKIRQLS